VPHDEVAGQPTRFVLVFPTGEAGERAWLLALHSRGDERTPEEEQQFRALAAKHGHPGLTFKVLRLHDKLTIREAEGRLSPLLARVLAALRLEYGLDPPVQEQRAAAHRRSQGAPLTMADKIALHAANRRVALRRFAAIVRTAPCQRAPRGRAPRSRRVRTSRTSHGPPGRQDDDPDEPRLSVIPISAFRVEVERLLEDRRGEARS
jgi:hypothetical protein